MIAENAMMEAPIEVLSEENEVANPNDSGGEVKPTKKSLKRQANQVSWKAYQQDKKRAKKEIKRKLRAEDNARLQAEREDQGLTVPSTTAEAKGDVDRPRPTRLTKEEKQADFLARAANNFEVIIDCGWEDEHPDKEMASLIQQIMYCYGANRRQSHPVKFSLFSLGPRVRRGLEKIKFESWLGFRSFSEGLLSTDEYKTLATSDASSSSDSNKKELIYLTSDADEVLTELSPNHAYVIGGIVDRNRLKGATFKKAQSLNIRTAKLPIKEHVQLSSSHILTVNHVFDILLRFQESRDWVQTLAAVLPPRKEAVVKNQASPSNIDASEEQEQEEVEGEVEDGA